MEQQPSVLVVEDEAPIAELLTVNLRYNGFQPRWAVDADSARHELGQALPALIVLDWMLPGDSGMSLLQSWRADSATRHIPVLMLTARGDAEDRLLGLESGADDYMVKPFSTRELIARIRQLIKRREAPPPQEALRVGELLLDLAGVRVMYQGQTLRLGPTDFKLLRFFMVHRDQVHTRAQLRDMVWGPHARIEERTVDAHIRHLRQALGEAAGMVETVRNTGYRLTAESA